jgi:hypothetical protein
MPLLGSHNPNCTTGITVRQQWYDQLLTCFQVAFIMLSYVYVMWVLKMCLPLELRRLRGCALRLRGRIEPLGVTALQAQQQPIPEY